MSWQQYKIGDFLTRSKVPVKIKKESEYTLVTIRMYHKGVVKRSTVQGSTIKSPTLYKVNAGQFILSGIDARNGAFGIVPEELEDAIVTNDFWTHDIDTTIINIDFFYWFTTTPQFYEACIKASEGTTNRRRLQADKFYSFDVHLPSINEQKDWVKRISFIKETHELLETELNQQQTYLQLLSQIILQEAIEGKLTKQDIKDEPATELLKSIEAEKENLIKAGKLKKEKELSPITEDEIPFELPQGWTWCRLGEVVTLFNGRAYKQEELLTEGVPVIRIQNLNGGKSWYYSNLKLEENKYCSDGDLLFAWSGTFGPYIWKGKKSIYHYHIWKVEHSQFIEKDYIFFLLSYLSDEIKGKAHGLMLPHMTKSGMENWIIPLPPQSKQLRIVNKVQQLQQYLSQLDTQVQQGRQYVKQLLQSVLKEAFEGNRSNYMENRELDIVAK